MKLYPLRDTLTRTEKALLGKKGIKAVATGENRPPMAGEWFLSGAIVEAYRARADLSTVYPIARLVKG